MVRERRRSKDDSMVNLSVYPDRWILSDNFSAHGRLSNHSAGLSYPEDGAYRILLGITSVMTLELPLSPRVPYHITWVPEYSKIFNHGPR